MEHFDIGLVGYWYATNYGSILTYYALSLTLNKMGYSTVLIDRPEKERDPEGEDVISRNFLKKHCNISKSVKWDELKTLSDLCDSFMIGSDQVWTASAIRYMKYMFFLSFVDDSKKKIAYAPSFGSVNFIDINEEQTIEVMSYLSKFDKISIREASGVDLLKNKFKIKADRVLDPVFLITQKDYDDIAAESDINTEDKYILAYILDPTPDKEEFIKKVSEKINVKVKIVLDGRKGTFPKNRQKFLHYCDESILSGVNESDWVKLFRDSEYVLTDSHHGLAMAIIYNKNYICYANRSRGYERFTSLLNLLDMTDRMIDNAEQLTDKLISASVNYDAVDLKLDEERKKSVDWLKEGLETSKGGLPKVVLPEFNNTLIQLKNYLNNIKQKNETRTNSSTTMTVSQDFVRCRMLVTLVRDYGIKHVVLSSGTRNLNLVRLFEANNCFHTYNVIDERSAGFYALGLATKLRQPVAMCCTSGTAASNYLSAITEAYYQGIPIVVISADRHPAFLGQNEDQTIPQSGMFEKVCKKSVTIPVASGYLSDWESRRLVCEALLEVNHHGNGPVHINIPIETIQRPKPDPTVMVLDKHIRRIERFSYEDSAEKWDYNVKRLSSFKRILIVYGQSFPISEQEQNVINKFVQKFHAVVITDHLSNYHGENTIMSVPITNSVSQSLFDEFFAPDICITVGGRRMLNDPITWRIRNQKRSVGHWRVSEDGEVRDTFRKLSRIFECSPQYFFKYFVESDIQCNNDDEYLDVWKAAAEKYKTLLTNEYCQKYIVQETVMHLPPNSSVHYGIGRSIMFANRYPLDSTVEVFCNMGTNGIDGCASSFMGQARLSNHLCFLIISDLSFFYDMNSLWNKPLQGNIRILMCNNCGTGLLRDLASPAITHEHNASAEGWVKSLGFTYLSSNNKEDFDQNLRRFLSDENVPIFFEAFVDEN